MGGFGGDARAVGLAQRAGDVGQQIITRCLQDQSLGGFTQAAYGKALKELQRDERRVQRLRSPDPSGTEGRRVRQRCRQRHLGGRRRSDGDRCDRRDADRAARDRPRRPVGSAPVSLGNGQVVHPGVVHADIASAFSTLPGPLLAVLAFLLAAAAGAGRRNRSKTGT